MTLGVQKVSTLPDGSSLYSRPIGNGEVVYFTQADGVVLDTSNNQDAITAALAAENRRHEKASS